MIKRDIVKILRTTIKKNNKPILITGARQVGKTTVIKEISKDYDQAIYINLEIDNVFRQIVEESNLEFHTIMNSYCAITGLTLTSETIILFDEIQFCSKLLTGLKYFYESNVTNQIIATGSNLGLSINKESEWSFPVGKVNLLKMYPLTFKEFLTALDKEQLINYIKDGIQKKKILDVVHSEILRLFDIYINTGGMPEAVYNYIVNSSLNEVKDIQESILNGYSKDILKYADSKTSSRIYDIYDNVDIMLSSDTQKFKITKIDSNTYKDIVTPLSWLIETGLVYRCDNIGSINLPLRSNVKENNFKLFYSDVGLLMRKSNYVVGPELIKNDKLYLGMVIENYFATILKYNNFGLFCYKRRTTEIDFVIQDNMDVIPIEVKSGNNTKAKSLKVYIENYSPKKAYKFSRNNFSINGIIHNYPVYSFEFIDEFND